MARFFQNIEITRSDGLALRELVRPFCSDFPDAIKVALADFVIKLYAALIQLEREGVESVNIPMNENECLIINQKVGNEDWEGAIAILRQTWAVLYELKNDMPPGTKFVLDDILKSMAEEHADDKPEANTA